MREPVYHDVITRLSSIIKFLTVYFRWIRPFYPVLPVAIHYRMDGMCSVSVDGCFKSICQSILCVLVLYFKFRLCLFTSFVKCGGVTKFSIF